MGILLKTTLKNIFGKPFRTLLVVFSVFACSFVALFSLDLNETEKGVIEYELRALAGTADLYTVMRKLDMERLPTDLPEYESLVISVFNDTLYADVEGEYQIVTTKSSRISGLDPSKAGSMINLKTTEIGDDEIVITTKYADILGAKVGDRIRVNDLSGEKHEFTVKEIVPPDPKSFVFEGISGVVNEKGTEILSCGKAPAVRVLLDILDDTQIDRAEALLKKEFGERLVARFTLSEEDEAIMNEIFGFLFILFAITLLLVVFISFSISERIVGERMSFIGTLRSLGLSVRKTTLILLSENALYAVLGSVSAALVYILVRGSLNNILFAVNVFADEADRPVFPEMSLLPVLLVILAAVLVECLIPLKAVLRAMKTSIRDIIFDNRDTEYKFKKSGIVVGMLLAVAAAVTAFMAKDPYMAALCLISAVVSLGLLYPLILKAVTSLLIRIGEKRESAKLALAAKEAVSKKSTVGSGILCATSATMCMIIYLLSVSMASMFETDVYDCDVIVTGISSVKDLSFTKYLEEVTDEEFVYRFSDDILIGGDEKARRAFVCGWPEGGYRFYKEYMGLPEHMEDGQVFVERSWANKQGLDIGDEVRITYNSTGVLPIERDYTVGGFIGASTSAAVQNVFVVSQKEFRNIYRDQATYLLLRSSDPDKTAAEIERYGVGMVSEAKTKEKQLADNRKQNASLKALLYAVIAVAVIMSCIGMISNQMIGFEGRKKECAVLLSTTMTRKTMAGMLFKEMLIASAVSVSAGTLLGMALIAMLKTVFANSEALAYPIELHYETVIILWVIMLVIYALTVLFPIRNMRKMKLSEQLKYE